MKWGFPLLLEISAGLVLSRYCKGGEKQNYSAEDSLHLETV